MQQTSPCTNCGAEIPLEARFCRSCGKPSARFSRESVTEGTTRLLETPERPAAQPAPGFPTERPGELAQMTNRLPPQGAETSRGLDVNRKPTNWLLIGAIVVAALALIATGLFIGLRSRSTPRTTPVVVAPGVPPVQPPPPPGIPPPPSTGVTQGAPIDPALIYPGAKTVLQGAGDDGDFIQLQTSDSFDKVVNWYKEKLKPDSTVEANDPNTGQPGRSVVLASKQVAAIITAGGDTTNIMLARGEH
ncbi:MAG TPA: zinc ribbon domain-containing protein [Pyrinomonadaceae bacterium]|nr:zinc ribbon domain-containing protein [Pyrinomonadaceae bacterium]